MQHAVGLHSTTPRTHQEARTMVAAHHVGWVMSQLISPLMMAPSEPDAMSTMSSPSAVLQSTSSWKSAHAKACVLVIQDHLIST